MVDRRSLRSSDSFLWFRVRVDRFGLNSDFLIALLFPADIVGGWVDRVAVPLVNIIGLPHVLCDPASLGSDLVFRFSAYS